jgi:HD-GYP domain-containing protein (c-di-GMP phosphodiesterase class II)
MGEVRLAEALAALSLATDVGNGLPLEKSLRDAIIAARLARVVGAPPVEQSEAYYAALLRSIGCTAYGHETAAQLGGDDVAFHRVFQVLDPGRPRALAGAVARGMGAWAPTPLERAKIAGTFLLIAGREGKRAGEAACEASAALAGRMRLPAGIAATLVQIWERWDGKGVPAGTKEEALTPAARIVHVADIAEFAHARGGVAAARAEVAARAGGHFDPALARAFDAHAGEILDGLGEADALLAALSEEPAPRRSLPETQLDQLTEAFGDFADLKSPWWVGHSRRVAAIAAAAAPAAGPAMGRAAGLHDLGRVSVPNGIWAKPGPLSAAERDRVRLYPYYTHRILERTPALSSLAATAAAAGERLDGTGYHRSLDGRALDRPMRVLAAADAYAAMTAERPHRPALAPDAAARQLRDGPFCPDAVEAVLSAAGRPPARRRAYPCELTEREVEVLGLLARGLTNKQIAERLVVSPRTVGHHVAHVYAKTGRRTRAGAALFAAEHGLADGR